MGELPPPILRDPNPGLLRALLHAFYDGLWLLAALVASPWWLWRAATRPAFRRMVADRLTVGLPALGARRRVLLHGVSVGEVKATQPLVRELSREEPGLELVISTTTDTGLAEARRLYPELTVVRFPFDPSPLVNRFLRRLAPDVVVLVELEIWPNFLRAANRRSIPVAVVNGRITERSFGQYGLFRDLLPQFNRITLFCVQDEEYGRRFHALSRDPRRLVVTGNIKADSLRVGRVEPGEELRRLVGPRPGQACVVAGSTHEPEERWLAEAWRRALPETRLILVPRHPARAPELARALGAIGLAPQLLGELRAGAEVPDPDRPAIVDTIGELERVYGLADLAFVGGSLVEHGGQNMLEPAAQGLPVVHGPHVANFQQEAALLERAGASRRLAGLDELAPCLAELLADPALRRSMALAGERAVTAQQGATRATLAALRARCYLAAGPAGGA